MAENNPGGLSDREFAAQTRVAQKENPSAAQIEIRRSTAERNRPDDSAEYIADAGARGPRATVRGNPATPCREWRDPHAR